MIQSYELIEKELIKASELATGETLSPDLTYEEGIRDALAWVLGNSTSPLSPEQQ